MSWYKTALRKHMMRADLHVHVGEETDFTDPQVKETAIKSLLTAAIIKGLDAIGIVAHGGPSMGWRALQISKQTQLDLWVIPGQEYVCADRVRVLVYYLREPLPANLTYEQVATHAHKQRGLVMALDLTKRQSQMINSLKGKPTAPDAVEIYNAAVGGFHDVEVDYPEFISSASKSAKDMEAINVFTLINRQEFEKIGFLPDGEGEHYVPKYLQHDDEIAAGADPGQVAEGTDNPGAAVQAPAVPNSMPPAR